MKPVYLAISLLAATATALPATFEAGLSKLNARNCLVIPVECSTDKQCQVCGNKLVCVKANPTDARGLCEPPS
ncbi:hypothetical protein TWF694_011349 [Orbilia ellipsospora]|uniref:Uncharacterized protein n=1 Tax=Orbilia ellipsospora TaxID=2528407 RepID=A0AAV9X575_9PEZI